MLTQSRAEGFSKVRVSELFNLLELTVEHKVNAIRIYMYNVDDTAFITFKKKKNPGKMIKEKYNIADVVSCEEMNHYNRNCLMAAMHVL